MFEISQWSELEKALFGLVKKQLEPMRKGNANNGNGVSKWVGK